MTVQVIPIRIWFRAKSVSISCGEAGGARRGSSVSRSGYAGTMRRVDSKEILRDVIPKLGPRVVEW